jgi:hypothetical protein
MNDDLNNIINDVWEKISNRRYQLKGIIEKYQLDYVDYKNNPEGSPYKKQYLLVKESMEELAELELFSKNLKSIDPYQE